MNHTEITSTTSKVAILMATYNASSYLNEQLYSFLDQDYPSWKLYVSDDGSTDNTTDIIRKLMLKNPTNNGFIQTGPQKGFAANFMSLICNDNIIADYYAYSDQDDIWDSKKLSNAISFLDKIDCNIPALYCSRTQLIDSYGNTIGFSPSFKKKPSFKNAIIQSIAGGNTMVFNHAAKKLLEKAGNVDIVSHDWWTYIVITACGGTAYYDQYPTVKYRQHTNNLVGTNLGIKQKLKRLYQLFNGDFSNWTKKNIDSLQHLEHEINKENIESILAFKAIKHKGLMFRFTYLSKFPFYRQTFLSNLIIYAAAFIGKV